MGKVRLWLKKLVVSRHGEGGSQNKNTGSPEGTPLTGENNRTDESPGLNCTNALLRNYAHSRLYQLPEEILELIVEQVGLAYIVDLLRLQRTSHLLRRLARVRCGCADSTLCRSLLLASPSGARCWLPRTEDDPLYVSSTHHHHPVEPYEWAVLHVQTRWKSVCSGCRPVCRQLWRHRHVLKRCQFDAEPPSHLKYAAMVGSLHCSGCNTRHFPRWFSAAQRRLDGQTRICIGREGSVRLCEHRSFTWADVIRLYDSHGHPKTWTKRTKLLDTCPHPSHALYNAQGTLLARPPSLRVRVVENDRKATIKLEFHVHDSLSINKHGRFDAAEVQAMFDRHRQDPNGPVHLLRGFTASAVSACFRQKGCTCISYGSEDESLSPTPDQLVSKNPGNNKIPGFAECNKWPHRGPVLFRGMVSVEKCKKNCETIALPPPSPSLPSSHSRFPQSMLALHLGAGKKVTTGAEEKKNKPEEEKKKEKEKEKGKEKKKNKKKEKEKETGEKGQEKEERKKTCVITRYVRYIHCGGNPFSYIPSYPARDRRDNGEAVHVPHDWLHGMDPDSYELDYNTDLYGPVRPKCRDEKCSSFYRTYQAMGSGHRFDCHIPL